MQPNIHTLVKLTKRYKIYMYMQPKSLLLSLLFGKVMREEEEEVVGYVVDSTSVIFLLEIKAFPKYLTSLKDFELHCSKVSRKSCKNGYPGYLSYSNLVLGVFSCSTAMRSESV